MIVYIKSDNISVMVISVMVYSRLSIDQSSCTGTTRAWHGHGTDMARAWHGHGTGMARHGHVTGMSRACYGHVTGMAQARAWHGMSAGQAQRRHRHMCCRVAVQPTGTY